VNHIGVSGGSDKSHWSSLVKVSGAQFEFEQYGYEGLWDMWVRWVKWGGSQVGHMSRLCKSDRSNVSRFR
jgi:hypothetical protein